MCCITCTCSKFLWWNIRVWECSKWDFFKALKFLDISFFKYDFVHNMWLEAIFDKSQLTSLVSNLLKKLVVVLCIVGVAWEKEEMSTEYKGFFYIVKESVHLVVPKKRKNIHIIVSINDFCKYIYIWFVFIFSNIVHSNSCSLKNNITYFTSVT